MTRARSLQFFCTRQDLLAVLCAVEVGVQLQYVRIGLFENKEANAFLSASKIEDLGISRYGGNAKDAAYLVMRSDVMSTLREVPQKAGGALYALDQLMNPDSVVLRPGGLFADQTLIGGQVGTASGSEESVALYETLGRGLRSACKKVRSYWVGPEARVLWKKGFRLTSGADAPRSMDLSEE